jgi:hypothetical protein
MEFTEELKSVDVNLFERVWKIVVECGEEERHFNQLQSIYRGLASTWLLASGSAVGYLLKADNVTDAAKANPTPHWGIAIIVCIAAALGIGLIWILDLHVYHRLLVAVFNEGKKLEDDFRFLPKFRTAMQGVGRSGKGAENHDPIRKRLAGYYVFSTSIPIVAAAYFLYRRSNNHYQYSAALVVLGFILITWVYSITTKKEFDHPVPGSIAHN